MSSRCRGKAAAAAGLLALLCACDRESRNVRGQPLGETVPAGQSPDTIFPGNSSPPPRDPRAGIYEENAYAISQGQQLFTAMNCVGCHSHGGGGMGPALMDGKWRYGGRIDQIAASIANGRPNGMPAWGTKLTGYQIWQLAAYVKSLAGDTPKDAVSARADTMSSTPPQTQETPQPVRPAGSGQQ